MSDNYEGLLCVVSPHHKGFWQADIYLAGWDEGVSPDWFCTGLAGGSRHDVVAKALESHPGAKVVSGLTGTCDNCSAEFFNLEEICVDCGDFVSD